MIYKTNTNFLQYDLKSSFFIALVFITAQNTHFIDFLGFDFSLSKLILFFLSPLLLTKLFLQKKTIISIADFVFLLLFISAIFRTWNFESFKYISDMSNYLLPLLFYEAFRTDSHKINVSLVVRIIILYSFLHACFGQIQFITQDRSLVPFDEIQEYKITKVESYFFNPFKDLVLLPHGLYYYSSVFSIALTFPFFLLLGSYHLFKNKVEYFLIFLTILSTIFFCFSRFEILSVFLGLTIALFVIKKHTINQKLLIRITFLFIFITMALAIYFYYLFNGWGTITARLVNIETIQTLFPTWITTIIGNDYAFFRNHFTIDIPHNVFVYCLYAFGISGLLVIVYFGIHSVKQFRFLSKNGSLYSSTDYRLASMICFYLLYDIFFRGFDYYIFDGYENVLTIFFCLLLLDLLKHRTLLTKMYTT